MPLMDSHHGFISLQYVNDPKNIIKNGIGNQHGSILKWINSDKEGGTAREWTALGHFANFFKKMQATEYMTHGKP